MLGILLSIGSDHMRTRVQKWGHSLALRIPKSFAEELGMRDSTPVDLATDGDVLIVRPLGKRYTLAELLSGVTDDNVHGEVDMGKPFGREVVVTVESDCGNTSRRPETSHGSLLSLGPVTSRAADAPRLLSLRQPTTGRSA